ncbi:MAG: cysteine hydrolase [Parasphingorhabdus sp.]
MTEDMIKRDKTALAVIDPYNDFLSFGGKSWLLNRATLRALDTNKHLEQLLDAARSVDMTICFAPHARYRTGAFDGRRYLNPSIYLARFFRTFTDGKWGGRFRKGCSPLPSDFVAREHLVSSGFVNTDLDEHLREKGIENLVLCGCLSNTCIESTARSAIELGYRVTIISDALAAMSKADHEAATQTGFPMCAHEVISTSSFIGSLKS